ncbi:MAG TPA: hypothetical protein VGY77_05795 [Gemmataceae bacterium]|nr:hypothetical protein [Gemmataceae bacterium]
MHAAIFALVVGGSFILVQAKDKQALEVGQTVDIVDGQRGDNGTETSDGYPTGKQEAGPSIHQKPHSPAPEVPVPELNPPTPTLEQLPEKVDRRGTILENVKKSNEEFAKATEGLRKQILGKPDSGRGPKGRIDDVITRLDRWVLVFETRDGRDYLRQLDSLGAILAIPISETKFMVYHDLKGRPPKGKIEEITKIEQIFWIDDKPESVRSLANVLQWDPIPPRVVAFFPQPFEDELLRKELKFNSKKEHEIRKTYFRMERRGNRYEAVVRNQILID